MRKLFIISTALLLALTFASLACAQSDAAVKAAKAKFKGVRAGYIEAKNELSDAQIASAMTTGKAEKEEATKRIWTARRALRKAKKEYTAALSALHKAESARNAKIDRSPWN